METDKIGIVIVVGIGLYFILEGIKTLEPVVGPFAGILLVGIGFAMMTLGATALVRKK